MMHFPNAASHERRPRPRRDVEKDPSATPGVPYYSSVIGFSLLMLCPHQLQRLLFVTFHNPGVTANLATVIRDRRD